MNKVFISCKESRIENNKSFYGCFNLGPFNEGESLTIANALRRTLLSECPGLAIISVLMEDVNHEYSTLSGVRDSVLDILLNLKEIVLKKTKNPWFNYKRNGVSSVYNQVGTAYFKPVVGYLKVKGPGVVRAKDLRLPPFIQCVDPDQYIATLSENGQLNIKFVIMEGKSSIIQKANSLVDYSLVKKRRILLNQLKELIMKSTLSTKEVPKTIYSNKYNSLGLREAVNSELFNTRLHRTTSKDSSISGYSLPDGDNLNNKNSTFAQKEDRNENEAKKKEVFKNASPLNIDAVFSPIKKVNYIIEVSENKIVNNSNEKNSFMNNISTLIESGDFYKANFPFLTTAYSFFSGVSSQTMSKDVWQNTSFFNDVSLQENKRSNSLEDYSSNTRVDDSFAPSFTSDEEKNFMQDLMDYVETYSTDELLSTARSLHPLRKEGSLHTVILEIWTNGSLHPREALSMAFSHLTTLFMNLDKTKIFNPIYKDVSSYKKCLNSLPTLKTTSSSNVATELDVQNVSQVNSLFARKPKTLLEGLVEEDVTQTTSTKKYKRLMATTKTLDIGSLNINLRTYTQLKRANIKTIGDLVCLSKKKLSDYYKLDNKSIQGIAKSLEEVGFALNNND